MLLTLLLTACGSDASTSTPTAAVLPTDASTSTSTIPIDRSLGWSERDLTLFCSLRQPVIDAAYLLRITIDGPIDTEPLPSRRAGLVTRDSINPADVPPPVVDRATAHVDEVLAARSDDPRPNLPIAAGDALTTFQVLQGSVLPDLVGAGPIIAAIAPWDEGNGIVWKLETAARENADGSLSFFGACASQIGLDLGALASGRGVAADVGLLATTIESALVPGFMADVDYLIDGFGLSDGVPLPPLLVGRVTVTGLLYDPVDATAGIVSLRSGSVGSAYSNSTANGVDPSALPAFFVVDEPIELVVDSDAPRVPGTVLATLPAGSIGPEQALVADFDLSTMTGTLTVITLEEFSARSGYPIDSLHTMRDGYLSRLVASTDVPEPERAFFPID